MAGAPVLVVTDVAARLERRGLLAPAERASGWRRVRVLVYARGPVVCERPPGAWLVDVALHPGVMDKEVVHHAVRPPEVRGSAPVRGVAAPLERQTPSRGFSRGSLAALSLLFLGLGALLFVGALVLEGRRGRVH
jgi:hypothetical protein